MKYNENLGKAITFEIEDNLWLEFKKLCKLNKLRIQGQIEQAIINRTKSIRKSFVDGLNNIQSENNNGKSRTFRVDPRIWQEFKSICKTSGLKLVKQMEVSIIENIKLIRKEFVDNINKK